MERDEEVQEYLDLSLKYLTASKNNLENELLEPALFNGLHSLELAIKAILVEKVEGSLITHNVGGLLGKHYRESMGEDRCKLINGILIQYNIPRYPGVRIPGREEIKETLSIIEEFIREDISKIFQYK